MSLGTAVRVLDASELIHSWSMTHLLFVRRFGEEGSQMC